jgi:hypothetical protein
MNFHALVYFDAGSTEGDVAGILIGLAAHDGDLEDLGQIFAQLGEKLARCLGVGPIGPIEEEEATWRVVRVSLHPAHILDRIEFSRMGSTLGSAS